ncbi:MAG: hypothetical protein RBQ97_01515 [Acholeplasma sp.]|mgnify:CR=1 FL=1|jgi:hypothetical protein|nr:hypothetical protein [Acholeplasma sp.]
MNNQNCVDFPKIRFCGDMLFIKRRKPIQIRIQDIESLYYAKWSFSNYFSLAFGDFKSPGFLYIILKRKKIFNKSLACTFKYNDLEKIPDSFRKILVSK